MPTPTFAPTTSVVAPVNEAPTRVVHGTVVLDRIAHRVRQRLAEEQSEGSAGAHAASLIWPWPV